MLINMKFPMLFCLLFITSAAFAQQKRRVKVQEATDSLFRHIRQWRFDASGRKISVKFKDNDAETIITYSATGKEKSRENSNGTIFHEIWTNYFDKNDNLVSLESYDVVNDSKFEAVSYTYDKKNRELTRSYYHPGGELDYRIYKSYDDDNNTDTTSWYSHSVLKQSISKYDNDRKEIFREFHSGDDTVAYTTFIYDTENRLVEKKMRQGSQYENTTYQYYPNGDELKRHTDERTRFTDWLIEDWEYNIEYDADGNRTKSTTVWKKNGKLLEKTVLRYSYEYY